MQTGGFDSGELDTLRLAELSEQCEGTSETLDCTVVGRAASVEYGRGR